ncbi:MAG: hypothetical protein C4533_06540 [Candidatus Omnitrophota bacterium]|jgi:glycosyltransferase involved in cell wall biosynthesis|nr:MAG: hypothetical protein C4533_06540 [Candidatus Omnitrophota bacterium]
MSRSICIITPDYISLAPRVIKEADSLVQAGYKVNVVFSQGNLRGPRIFDEKIIAEKRWDCKTIGWSPSVKGEKRLFWKSRLRSKFLKTLPSFFWSFDSFAEQAEGRVYNELLKSAISVSADIYIGHYPTGLALAANAAYVHGAKFGYDIADLHTEEQLKNAMGLRQTERIRIIESKYLKRCSFFTASSDLIAQGFSEKYSLAPPVVLYNAFPYSERENLDGRIIDRRGEALSLYWFANVISLDRGLQDAIKAAGLLNKPVQIHIRGNVSQGTKKILLSLAKECRVEQKVYFHNQVPPSELISRAAEHDVGLSLDCQDTLNRGIAIPNKLFIYLISGLCIAASDTPGQKYIFSKSPDIGFIYRQGDYRALASYLEQMCLNNQLLKSAKEASLAAARDTWNWENESRKLLDKVNSLF